MRRRNVLKMGAALATLQITGCGPSTPEATGPADAKAAGKGGPSAPPTEASAVPSANPEAAPAPSSSADANAGAPKDPNATQAAGTEAAQVDAPRTDLTRVIARIGKNHGHSVVVPFADVSAGAEKTYEITAGTSGHKHAVTLTADQMKTLMTGKILRTKSTNDRGHEHRFVVRCAPPVDPPEWITACKASFTGQDEHELIIPIADLEAKADKTYDVQGIAGHAHTVTLTTADYEKLLKGGPVTTKTTREPNDAHLHVVQIDYKKPKGKPA